MLYLLGFDLPSVFTSPAGGARQTPGATSERRAAQLGAVLGNFAGALTVAVFMAIIFTNGFTDAPNAVGQKIGSAKATVGYAPTVPPACSRCSCAP